MQSPTGALDRFNSPATDNRAKRQLFTSGAVAGSATTVKSLLTCQPAANNSDNNNTAPATGNTTLVKDVSSLLGQSKNITLYKQTQTEDGRPVSDSFPLV